MSHNVVLQMRPVRDDDEPFLRKLFAVIDSENLGLNFVEASIRESIVNHQFEARRAHYQNVDMESTDCVILADDVPVGRLIVMQNGQEIRLADLAILPEYRRRGIATAAIQGILGESVQSKRPVTLHVHKTNDGGVMRLYQRLGFRILKNLETHYFMQWSAEALG